METKEGPDITWEPLDVPSEDPKTETKETPEKERLLGLLDELKKRMESITQNEPGINPEEAKFTIDSLHLNLESKNFQYGSFAFWGGLHKSVAFPELNSKSEVVPVLKNIRIPEAMRGKGVGSKIVEGWEDVLSRNGFETFVVTNLDEDSIRFWRKRGYQIPQGEQEKETPYYMFKKKGS